MLLYLSLFGIFLSSILIANNAKRNWSSVYLGMFFLLLSITVLTQYVIVYSKSVFWIALFYVNFGGFSFLIGPCLYWYVRSVLTDNTKLTKYDLLHLIPIVIFYLLATDYILTQWSYKLSLAEMLAGNINNYGRLSNQIVSKLLTAFYLFRPFLTLAYLAASIISVVKFRSDKSYNTFIAQKMIVTKWLPLLFIFTTLLTISFGILITKIIVTDNYTIFYTFYFLRSLTFIGLLGLLISPFFYPSILYGLPHVPEKKPSTDTNTDTIKKNSLSLENEYIELIESKIEESMTQLKPYIHESFNLNQLAVLIQIPTHHLAYYFKEHHHLSFTDFKNNLRIEYAKKLMSENKASEITLEGIGILSGFSSRNTFLRAFKKAEGITPNEFLNQLRTDNKQ